MGSDIPLKRRKIECVSNSNIQSSNDNIPALIPSTNETTDHHLENALIAKIDAFINSIKRNDEKCQLFEAAKRRMNEKNNEKLEALSDEMRKSEQCILTKYKVKEIILKNEFDEKMEKAKEQMIRKYEVKRANQARLFKQEFVSQCEKYKNETNENTNDFIIESDLYRRPKLLNDKMTKNNERCPQFFNADLQTKWQQMNQVSDDLLLRDLNDMDGQCLSIEDILSLFPQCDVTYKSDTNCLRISSDKEDVIALRIGSFIACHYTRQAVMIGHVQSISAKQLTLKLRPRGDKYAKYSMVDVAVEDIETGKLEIKLIR